MAKTIIFCADGTWGSADGKLVNIDHISAGVPVNGVAQENSGNSLTNVSMLFEWLEGETITSSPYEMERSNQPLAAPTQIAKYVHGVGDGAEFADKVVDGMFGIGVVARIANGYNYISEHYKVGDRIVLVGFSRGAYTVRALAGLIASEGLLTPALATESCDAGSAKYDNAVKAWLRYRKKSDTTVISRLLDWIDSVINYRYFFSSSALPTSAFVAVSEITAVAVWDTVGAMGIPLYGFKGKKVDSFNFASNVLSPKVKLGLHAVAIDEPRKAFTPTLWDETKNVKQRLFAGVHTDIGGGNDDHALSDVPLKWFFDELQHPDIGVLFNAEQPDLYLPDACAKGHLEPIEELLFPDIHEPRAFPSGMAIHTAVALRQQGGLVHAGLTLDAAHYAPNNLPFPAPVNRDN
ncbi:DUF2235 domain-containing protein [Glaciimonas sp. GG7]